MLALTLHMNDPYSQELPTASLVKLSSSPLRFEHIPGRQSSDQKILKKFNFSEIISYLLPTCQVKLREELVCVIKWFLTKRK